MKFIDDIQAARTKLLTTPLLKENPIRSKRQLQIFMEHHVFAVWDFMCLTKALQHHLAPSGAIWIPPENATNSRLINEIVMSEESDIAREKDAYQSHFELYVEAMEEVGASTAAIKAFQKVLRSNGFSAAAGLPCIPQPAATFMRSTLAIATSDKPWVVCAAFTFGREAVIPAMFQALQKNQVVQFRDCPAFSYYLERHIEVDGGSGDGDDGHGAMAIRLLLHLCDDKRERQDEAKNIALNSLEARERLWDKVYAALNSSELLAECA